MITLLNAMLVTAVSWVHIRSGVGRWDIDSTGCDLSVCQCLCFYEKVVSALTACNLFGHLHMYISI